MKLPAHRAVLAGHLPVKWEMENIPALKASELALNEGGYILMNEAGVADRHELSNGQNVIFQLQLKTEGTEGYDFCPFRLTEKGSPEVSRK